MLSKLIYFYLLLITAQLNSFTILLDPAGDAKTTGRSLANQFERGATLQFAQALQAQLMALNSQLQVILTKQAGETVDQLQVANFTNHLQVDLFLNLNFYPETNTKPNIFIYYYQNKNFFNKPLTNQLFFYPYDQAFMFKFDQTKTYATTLYRALTQTKYTHYFNCHSPIAMPFKPLAGIISPAIGIEIGLKQNGWEPYLQAVTASINELLEQHLCQ